MSEWLLVAGIVVAFSSGLPGLFSPRSGPARERLFVGLMTAATCCVVLGALASLFAGSSRPLAAPWAVPGGRLAIRVDALAAMFALPIGLLAGLGAWYGLEYWPQRSHPENGRKLRAFYGAITAGMLLLVVADNAILFLAGWEVMAAAAFVLVSTEDHDAGVRQTGYVYLLCTRAGTLCLFAMFALLGAAAGSFDFADFPRALASPLRDAIFVLGLCGFGLKAGVMPLHVWLPGAHASAPSHVSAVMSGVLIKTGIYGLVRLTAMCEAPPLWWGHALVGVGSVSAVLGVGFAIGQHDLKRLLAYHSVENIGIICLGLGVALLGRSTARADLVTLGLGGALLHVWNHGIFKGLLFLSAGSVLHATGTRRIDRLGGLAKRMPRTAMAFLVGAVAICGLPPLNGLVSELLVYLGLFRAGVSDGGVALSGILAAPALALVGALAVACFVKVLGAVFLGSPRSADVERAHEAGTAMVVPMVVLGGACLFIGLGAPLLGRVLDAATAAWSGDARAPSLSSLAPLGSVAASSAGLCGALALAGAWLHRRLRNTPARAVGTWDCGYAAPGARMQYTASSFAEMILRLLGRALRPTTHAPRLEEPFPAPAAFESHLPDTVLDRGVVPVFSAVGRAFIRLRPLQRGNIHLYFLYILGTLLALLLWR
jgi:hydrogenase-4 component B